MFLLNFLGPFKAYIYGAAICVYGLTFFAAYHYHSAYVEAQSAIEVKEFEVKQLTTGIDTCNASIDLAKKEADAQLAAAKIAMEKAGIAAKTHEKIAVDLLNSLPETTNYCMEASGLVKKYVANTKVQGATK